MYQNIEKAEDKKKNDKIDYLLTCLMEECNEVSKEGARALRFGLHDKWVENPLPADWKDLPVPHDALIHEFYDIVTVMEVLYEIGALKKPSDEEIAELVSAKKSRINKYMKYSAERGRYGGDLI